MRVRGSRLLKSVDRYAGVPLVALLGLRPRAGRPNPIRRVGLLRTAAIGDTLLLSGPLTDIRLALPDADLVLVTGEENADAGALVARGRARHLPIPLLRPFEAIRRLRRERFDVLIDTGAWPRLDALLTALSGARFRVGFQSAGQARHFGYDVAVPHSATVHEIDNYRALLSTIGIRGHAAPSIDSSVTAATPFASARGTIVVHPWAGGYRGALREWPADRWVDLAASLQDRTRVIAVSGGPGDAARSEQLVRAIRARGAAAESFAGALTLSELAGLLRESLAVVSVNTSVMHLAAIVGAPTVALHGPSSPVRWGPLGPRVVSVTSTLPGCGFLNHGFEYDGHREDCMLGISVDAVVKAVGRLLDS